MYLEVDLSTENFEYTATRQAIDELKRENMLLRTEVLENMSLTSILEKARKAGFIPIENQYVFLH